MHPSTNAVQDFSALIVPNMHEGGNPESGGGSSELRDPGEPLSTPTFAWSYGPTESDPDVTKMWHEGCGKEVLFIEGAFVCECGAQGDNEGNRIFSDSEKLDMVIAQLTMIQAKLENHDRAFEYLTGAMQWLTQMLGSVAQVAQNMPGMSGMVARMMGMGGKKNG